MTYRPLLVGVGGFLGAGKTTAIVAAAAHVSATGARVAVITNDQASGLVDTAVVRDAIGSGNTAEIAGGCFCCRFDDLARTLNDVIDRSRPDLILAEAVGSCTDLAATVYQPLRQRASAPVRLGPLTVVADATRLRYLARASALPRLSADVGYLFGQQLAEADVLLLNKTDALSAEEAEAVQRHLERQCPGVPVLPVSALRGDGMGAWLAALHERGDSGGRVLDLDYDRYAAAEAALGWLNLEGTVTLPSAERAAEWAQAVLAVVARRASDAGTEVAHVKLRLAAGDESLRASLRAHLTGTEQPPLVVTSGNVAGAAALTLNARVAADPETLHGWVAAALSDADATGGGKTRIADLRCFAPARPAPTYRLQPAASA